MASPTQPELAQEPQERIARCWLCGIRLPTALMVPDGGRACPDIRWYCRDMRACTGRWTAGHLLHAGGHGSAVSGNSSAAAP